MNIEQARFNMIEQQIRTWEVLDPQVLDLLFQVKREEFVPAAARELAFADLEIPLGHGEAMMQPKVEARILQELAIAARTRPSTRSARARGYLTALLAQPRAPRDQRGDPPGPAGTRRRATCARAGIAQRDAPRRATAPRAPLAESRLRRDRAHRLHADPAAGLPRPPRSRRAALRRAWATRRS